MIYASRNAQLIATLHPAMQAMANQWLGKLQTAKREVLITSGKRTPEEQQHLYEIGRTLPGKIVTNAKGLPVPQSMHCFGVALDFCPADAKGNLLWSAVKQFRIYAAVAKMCGFEWGGDWSGPLQDFSHLQYTGGMSLADFQHGKTLPPLTP